MVTSDLRNGKGRFCSKLLDETLRFPLLKNPEDLSEGQASALGAPRRSGTALWRGYLLKEELRAVFRGDPTDARASLDRWLSWACR